MIKVKIIDGSSFSSIDIKHNLEKGLIDIDPENIISITQNKLIGYTVFYKETKTPEETRRS